MIDSKEGKKALRPRIRKKINNLELEERDFKEYLGSLEAVTESTLSQGNARPGFTCFAVVNVPQSQVSCCEQFLG